jgi:hypothetical protein
MLARSTSLSRPAGALIWTNHNAVYFTRHNENPKVVSDEHFGSLMAKAMAVMVAIAAAAAVLKRFRWSN